MIQEHMDAITYLMDMDARVTQVTKEDFDEQFGQENGPVLREELKVLELIYEYDGLLTACPRIKREMKNFNEQIERRAERQAEKNRNPHHGSESIVRAIYIVGSIIILILVFTLM